MRVSDKWVRDYSTGEGWDPVTKELALDLGEARAELVEWKRMRNEAMAAATANRELIGELEAWVLDLQSGMYVNCIYCGHRYGPSETTPVSLADVLKAHVEKCPKHPMSQMRTALSGLLGLVQLLSRNEDIPAEIRSRMTRNHRFEDAQRCFPETKWDDYGLETPAAEDPNNGLPEPSSFPPMPPGPEAGGKSNSDPKKN